MAWHGQLYLPEPRSCRGPSSMGGIFDEEESEGRDPGRAGKLEQDHVDLREKDGPLEPRGPGA